MHRGRAKAPVLPVHKPSSSKRSSEEPKRIPALAYVAACFAIGVLIGKALRPQMAEFAPDAPAAAAPATNAPTAAATQKKLDPRVYAFYYAWYQNPATDGLWAHWNHKHLDHWDAAVRAKYPPFVHDPERRDVGACVELKILRRVRAESSRRPPRHRRDACSMAWRCRFLTARLSQDGRAIAEK